MELFSDNTVLTNWLLHYGSFAIFALLVLGIIALPVPEETLMVLAGTLLHKQMLHFFPTILATYAGSICGITTSYFIGKLLDTYFIHKYGSWIGITEARFQKAHRWFERYGKWMLFIGYFIPGVRHFTGLSAGITELRYRDFALFAYTGAIVWGTLFLSIGYFFGEYCLSFLQKVEIDIETLLIGSSILLVIFIGYKLIRKKH